MLRTNVGRGLKNEAGLPGGKIGVEARGVAAHGDQAGNEEVAGDAAARQLAASGPLRDGIQLHISGVADRRIADAEAFILPLGRNGDLRGEFVLPLGDLARLGNGKLRFLERPCILCLHVGLLAIKPFDQPLHQRLQPVEPILDAGFLRGRRRCGEAAGQQQRGARSRAG